MEKWKKALRNIGLGFLGGYLGMLIIGGIVFGVWSPFGVLFLILNPFMFFFPFVGGMIGGKINPNWWGPFLGGMVLSGLGLFLVDYMMDMIMKDMSGMFQDYTHKQA